MNDAQASAPKVAIVMGSASDWDTMRFADAALEELQVAHHCMVVSAHRTPERLRSVAREAERDGYQVLIAGAGGAAHLPGMLAAQTHLPVFGVPVRSRALQGLDSLLSIVQMPSGVPVGTLAIGEAGATNAALLAAAVLALHDPDLRERLLRYRSNQTERSEATELPSAAFRIP